MGWKKKANIPVSFNEFQARYKFNHPGNGWYQACIAKWIELKKKRDEVGWFTILDDNHPLIVKYFKQINKPLPLHSVQNATWMKPVWHTDSVRDNLF